MSSPSSCTCSSSFNSASSCEDVSSWSASLSCSDLTPYQSHVDLSCWDFENQFNHVDGSLYFMKLDQKQSSGDVLLSSSKQNGKEERRHGAHSKWSSWVAKRETKKKALKSASSSTGVHEMYPSNRPRGQSTERTKELDNAISSRNKLIELFKPPLDEKYLPTIGEEFVVLYINSESVNNDSDAGCYQFPSNGSGVSKSFSKLRGMFTTMMQVIQDTVHEAPMATKVEMIDSDGILVNYYISYKTSTQDLLVIAVKESVNGVLITAEQLSEVVHCMIDLVFGSLDGCFAIEANKSRLDRLLILLSRTLFQTLDESNIVASLLARLITLDDELDLSISEVLTEYETMDWIEEINCENYDEVVTSCMNFIIVGTCLFHNGFMVSSHFDQEVEYAVNTYLRCTGLLDISKSWDCKTLFFHQIYLKCNDLDKNGNKYWLMVVGIGHSLFASIFQVSSTNWSIDVAVQSVMLKESIKFLQCNLINSGLMDDIDRIISTQDREFQSSIDHLIHRRREHSSFLGGKSRSFRNLLSTNLGKGSFLTPDVMSKARSTPSLAPAMVSGNFLPTKTEASISTESNSSSLSIHNFLHSDQNARISSQKFNFYFKIDSLNRTIVSPFVNFSSDSTEETVRGILNDLRRMCLELEPLAVQRMREFVIESGKLIVVGSESIPLYVTREEIGSQIILYSVSDCSSRRNSISFVRPLL